MAKVINCETAGLPRRTRSMLELSPERKRQLAESGNAQQEEGFARPVGELLREPSTVIFKPKADGTMDQVPGDKINFELRLDDYRRKLAASSGSMPTREQTLVAIIMNDYPSIDRPDILRMATLDKKSNEKAIKAILGISDKPAPVQAAPVQTQSITSLPPMPLAQVIERIKTPEPPAVERIDMDTYKSPVVLSDEELFPAAASPAPATYQVEDIAEEAEGIPLDPPKKKAQKSLSIVIPQLGEIQLKVIKILSADKNVIVIQDPDAPTFSPITFVSGASLILKYDDNEVKVKYTGITYNIPSVGLHSVYSIDNETNG